MVPHFEGRLLATHATVLSGYNCLLVTNTLAYFLEIINYTKKDFTRLIQELSNSVIRDLLSLQNTDGR
jgi:hypothetical protein